MSTELKVIDTTEALKRAGGSSELAAELFDMLLQDLPQLQQDIRTHHASGDAGALFTPVHKLNGAATYCGVPALKAVVSELDIRLKRGETEGLDPLVTQVLAAIADIQAAPRPAFA